MVLSWYWLRNAGYWSDVSATKRQPVGLRMTILPFIPSVYSIYQRVFLNVILILLSLSGGCVFSHEGHPAVLLTSGVVRGDVKRS